MAKKRKKSGNSGKRTPLHEKVFGVLAVIAAAVFIGPQLANAATHAATQYLQMHPETVPLGVVGLLFVLSLLIFNHRRNRVRATAKQPSW
jgi:hypothetical protein